MKTPSPALTDRPRQARAKASRIKTAALAVALFVATAASAFAQNLESQEIQPASPAIGADVPANLFRPAAVSGEA